MYWSREPVPSNNITYENQRPFVMPRMPNQQDAVAVETTAYALLVYLARDGIGDLQERVVTWLNTMRMVEGGFVSIFVSSTLQREKARLDKQTLSLRTRRLRAESMEYWTKPSTIRFHLKRRSTPKMWFRNSNLDRTNAKIGPNRWKIGRCREQ